MSKIKVGINDFQQTIDKQSPPFLALFLHVI